MPEAADHHNRPGREGTRTTPRRTRKSAILCALVVVVGAIGFVTTVGTGRADSAMLFVGLPTLLALAIAVSPPASSVHGMTFKGLTLALLLAAVLLHEGAICVIFAAPLVYATGHLVAAAVANRFRRGYFAVPLALLIAMEGVAPDLRLMPEQTVSVTHTVAASPVAVSERIAAAPRVATTPRPALLAYLPLPVHAAGRGLTPGDLWRFSFHGDSHAPGGELVTEVVSRASDEHGGEVHFRRVSDTSIVARWLDWTSAELSWHAVADGTAVTLTLRFTRGLDPSWYFGPIQQALVRAAAGYLLDSLGLPDR